MDPARVFLLPCHVDGIVTHVPAVATRLFSWGNVGSLPVLGHGNSMLWIGRDGRTERYLDLIKTLLCVV